MVIYVNKNLRICSKVGGLTNCLEVAKEISYGKEHKHLEYILHHKYLHFGAFTHSCRPSLTCQEVFSD